MLVVVPVGSVVAFPNHDRFFPQRIFGYSKAKRFDPVFMRRAPRVDVHFDKRGISYIFCKHYIRDERGVVVCVDTPYYGISDQRGKL